LIRRCVCKDRHERIGDLAAALFVLRDPNVDESPIDARRQPRMAVWRRAVPVLVTAMMVVGGFVAGRLLRPSEASTAITRFSFIHPSGHTISRTDRQSIAISPDGRQLVYVDNGRLFVRSMSDLEAKPIPGTDTSLVTLGTSSPVFSPDGQWVAFHSNDDR